jgi:hypothetical protein
MKGHMGLVTSQMRPLSSTDKSDTWRRCGFRSTEVNINIKLEVQIRDRIESIVDSTLFRRSQSKTAIASSLCACPRV